MMVVRKKATKNQQGSSMLVLRDTYGSELDRSCSGLAGSGLDFEFSRISASYGIKPAPVRTSLQLRSLS